MSNVRGRNNFLTQLVERASDGANGMRPRVPGLFEPLSMRQPAEYVQPNDSGGEYLTASKVSDFDGDDANATRANSTPYERPSPMRTRSTNPVRLAAASSVPAFLQSDTEAIVEGKPITTPNTQVAGLAAPIHRGRLQAATVQRDSGSSTDADGHATHAARETIGGTNGIPSRHESEPQVTASTFNGELVKNTLTPKRVPANSPVTARETEREARPANSVRAQPEAVVHISIGRVEVRAMTAVPANTQQRAGNSRRPMSLDEYLNRKERAR